MKTNNMNPMVHMAGMAMEALSSRFGTQLEQTSGMSTEDVQKAVKRGDEKSLCWLQKAAAEVAERNPQLFARMQQMARGRNPFVGSR